MNSKLIIYPTDFSDCANNAMAYAIAMGKVFQCKIRIVHAVEIGALASAEKNPDVLLNAIKILVEQAEKKLIKLKEKIEAFNLESEYDIIKGRTLFLKDYMEKLDPLMIVLGTIGKNGLQNKIFGSFASQTIHNPKSIVFAIPQKAAFGNLSNLVFATDFHVKDKNCLVLLKKIMNYFRSNLLIVHISEKLEILEQDSKKRLLLEETITNVIRGQNVRFELLYGAVVEEKLLDLLESSKPDMLALITRKRNFIERVFGTSLSKKMVNHTTVPVLVFA